MLKMATPVVSLSARWHRFRLAETDASDHASAACYRRTKNIRVVPVVVAELKLRNVQRQILSADLVERAHDATLEQRPEAINRLRMDGTKDVFTRAVADNAMRILLADVVIAAVVIGREQADFVGNGLANELFHV